MRVLHVVKTSDGATWAAHQCAELVRLGVDVHVALPSLEGRAVRDWLEAGVTMHPSVLDFPARAPWQIASRCAAARELVHEVRPDLIHTHFVGPTLLLRLALGKHHPVPRIFQVAGPLHLEHFPYRQLEIYSAGPRDVWVASSRYILSHYQKAGLSAHKLFLSYHATRVWEYSSEPNGLLRKRFSLGDRDLIVGNMNFIYPPKYYLGQTIGVKGHEDIIDALGLVIQRHPNVVGFLGGGIVGDAKWYEDRLRARARKRAQNRIILAGYLPAAEIKELWPDFTCAIHVPISENCGGVGEPMLAGVPTIAGRVGGLPEVVIDGLTGKLVSSRQPRELAIAIIEVLQDLGRFRAMARVGQGLVRRMVDVRRTAAEVLGIYEHLLDRARPRPPEFDTAECARVMKEEAAAVAPL